MSNSKKNPKHYVDNKKLLEEISIYHKSCIESKNKGENCPPINNYIGKCILDIARGISVRPNFSGYTYIEDMIADGVENAIRAAPNFDPEKTSNPYGYFSRVIWFAFLRRIDTEKKEMYKRHKITERSVLIGTDTTRDMDTDGHASYIDLDNEYMSDFVMDYERKLEVKKQKKIDSERDRKNGLSGNKEDIDDFEISE